MPDNVFKIVVTLIGLIGSFGIFQFIYRLLSPKQASQSAMADISDMGTKDSSPFSRLENSQNPFDKLCFLFGRKFKQEQKMEAMFILLGRPAKLDPLKMLQLKLKLAIIIPVVLLLLGNIPLAVLGMLIGYGIPDMALWNRSIKQRQRDIIRGFPTFVDLGALMIESGLDYMTAFDRIVKISTEKTGLELEIEKTINEVQLGYSRRDALRRLSDRTGLQEVRSFVGLIVQSDELGTSLVELLRNYSADMRFRRLNKAEKMAAQASTKMLIPLFIFIFPTVFILMLAPMISDLIHGGMLLY